MQEIRIFEKYVVFIKILSNKISLKFENKNSKINFITMTDSIIMFFYWHQEEFTYKENM